MDSYDYYVYSTRVRAANTLSEADSSPFGPIHPRTREMLKRYTVEMSRLLATSPHAEQARQLHRHIITDMTIDGARQLTLATYAFATHDCKNEKSADACALVKDMDAQLQSKDDDTSSEPTDETLLYVAAIAQHAIDNVKGMSQRDKDGLARLISSANGASRATDGAGDTPWLDVAKEFSSLSPGARSVLNSVMKSRTGIEVKSVIDGKLLEHGHAPVPATGQGSAGCPLTAAVIVAILGSCIAAMLRALRPNR